MALSELPDEMGPVRERLGDELSAVFTAAPVSPAARQAVDVIRNSISRVETMKNSLFAEVDRLDVEADTMTPDGWSAERETAKAVAEAKLDQIDDELDVASMVLEAELVVASRPQIYRDDELPLRDEFRDRFASTPAADIESKLNQLAQSGRRDLAALAVTDWGRSWLEGKGHDDPDTFTRQFSTTLAATAEQHGLSERERTAGRAYNQAVLASQRARAAALALGQSALAVTAWTAERSERAARARAAGRSARVATARSRS